MITPSLRNSSAVLAPLLSLLLVSPFAAGRQNAGSRQGGKSGDKLSPAPDMSRPPQPGAVQPYAPPESHRDQIPNGLKIVTIEDHRFPLISVEIAFRAGNSRLAPDQAGLADAEADLLTEGTTTRSALQIAQEADALGGSIGASAGPDFLSVSGEAMSSNTQALLQLMADVVMHPAFRPEEVELRTHNMLQELEANRGDPGYLASVQFNKLLFGNNPYAITAPSEASIGRITRDALVQFHDKYLLPNNQATVVVAGDIDAARAHNLVYQYFGEWKWGRPESPASPPVSEPAATRLYIVDRPGSAQSQITLGNLGAVRTAPDYFAFLVANEVLGGSFNSRLVTDIREKQGLAYDIGSANQPRVDLGSWTLETQVKTASTADALQGILAELDRMQSAPPTAEELLQAKNYLAGNFVLSLETQGQVAVQFLGQEINGVPPDYLATWVDNIQKVTPEQTQAASRHYIHPNHAIVVVVGDAKAIESSLTRFTGGGSITLFNEKGDTIGSFPPEGTKPGGGH